MMNPGRILDFLSFRLDKDYQIPETDVKVLAGNNVLYREGQTYFLKKDNAMYAKFGIEHGKTFFTHLRGSDRNGEFDDEK